MAITVIGSSSGAAGAVSAALVEIKRTWVETWQHAPYLRFLGATATTGRMDPGSCQLEYRYGPEVKQTYDTDYETVSPLDLTGYWVRITMVSGNGVPNVVWVGRITAETREVFAETTRPAGKQIFTALEPLHLLERIHVSQSIWIEDGMDPEDALEVGFVPTMNGRDEWRMRVGNRSNATVNGSFVYGGNELWSRFDYLTYVFEHFVDEVDDDSPGDSTGPGWVLGGAVSLLRDIKDIVPFDDVTSVADILRKLVDARIGLDFKIVATDFSGTQGGFEIFVYALNAVEASFNGQTMPRNPQQISFRAVGARSFDSLTVVADHGQRYGRIRVVGRRAVCAVTLRGRISGTGESSEPSENPSLVPLWTEEQETAYKAGSSEEGADSIKHDLARTADKFASVYQDYGAPEDWDHNEGGAAPVIDTDTGLLEQRNSSPASGVFGQRKVRRTLSFVPIEDAEGKFLDPEAWIYDEEAERYITAQAAGCNVLALQNGWGLRLEANPNHLLALDHFDGAEETEVDPKYDHEKIVMTIAFETDKRLELVYETGERAGAEWKPSDGELVIHDDSAELWFAAPQTVKEIDQNGKLIVVEGEGQVELRNDIKQLYRWMAGAIGRYVNNRGRADLGLRGWHPYTHTVGNILTVVEERGARHQIQAPITSVQYAVAEGGAGTQTIIRAGFAR